MSFQEWADSVNGVAIDVDGNYGPQCWDLWSHYGMNVFGASMWATSTNAGGSYHHYGYACEIWHNFSGGPLGTWFTPVGADQPAQAGDVAIWEWGSAVGPNSHVAIVSHDQGGSIYCLTQNPGATHYGSLSKSGLLGYLRPDNQAILGVVGNSSTPVTGDVDTLARAVLRGEFGNGPSRQAALGAQYDAVQARVNEILSGAAPSSPAPAAPSGEVPEFYTVQSGDSFWAIAERFFGGSETDINNKMYELLDLNDHKRLFAGDTVRLVPAPTPPPAPQPAPLPEPVAEPATTPTPEQTPVQEEAKPSAETKPAAVTPQPKPAPVKKVVKKKAVEKSPLIENFASFDAVANATTTLEKSKMKIFTKGFWSYAVDRICKTTAQSAIALLSANGVGLLDVDWVKIASITGMMALLSFLTAVTSYNDTEK